ncbi:S-layer homology domain-containing protein [Cohnella terricola]|uniref:S-layer homology domain-containing protein n=1 Tax=Cohnella terricola TaxID=1289167 RepID=UPI0016451A52|nr:S-layer homology domain-containing protein [Cohnella terricola]
MKRLIAFLLSLILLIPAWTPSVSAETGDTIQVAYDVVNGDFSQGLAGWDNNNTDGLFDKIRAEHVVELKPGAAIWQPLAITGNADGPSVKDTVYAKVYATLSSDVTTDDNVLIRLVAGDQLAEIDSLSGAVREIPVELTSHIKNAGGRIPENQDQLWIELHNDTPGTIEVSRIEVWGVDAENRVKAYAVPNGDFSQAFEGNWESNGKATLGTAVYLEPGAAAWRSLPVGNSLTMPQVGDKVSVQAGLFVPSGVNRTDGVFVRLNDGHYTLRDLNDIAGTARGKWFVSSGNVIANEGIISQGSSELWIELHNDTSVPIRLKGLSLTAERAASSIYDLNGDGIVDEADAAWLSERIASGLFDARADFDRDGQLTAKDLSYFKKFALHHNDEFYLNMKHFTFMNEDITIDGVPMMVTHLYSEPIDRSDLSKGYAWVGDPQEGFAAVDDVARAVIAYTEHYGMYGDEFSYGKIKRGLEFLMWMQHRDGDFDNFVVRDPDGTIRPKDSASSQKSFSWWAVRAYEALATAMPKLKAEDSELAARVKERLALCLKRLKENTDPSYGQYVDVNGIRMAKWLLFGDTWLTSAAIDALAVHYKVADNASVKAAIRESVRKLGEGVAIAQFGDFRDFPYGGFMHHYNGVPGLYNWDEWGSIQVRAMAYAGQIADQPAWIEAAEHAADSFLGDLLISGRAETMHPNKKPYPLINYGTASYVDNWLALYEVTGKEKYAELAGIAASWWTGNNVRDFPMFNQVEGYAYDGLYDTEVNINSGAESLDEAIRALVRVLENPIAKRYLFAHEMAAARAVTIEIEDLYKSVAPPDERMPFPNGELNDPNVALVKQNVDSGTDELKIYEDAQHLGGEREVYPGWMGSNALFVAATGYNNIRLFNNGSIKTELPVGGVGNFQAGDAVKLEFSARVEFDTSLKAEVYAVLANGDKVRIADAGDMNYHPRTWYAGASSVKTTPLAKIPEGAVKLEVGFGATSTKTPPQEGYATVTEGKIYKMSVPEIRYSNTDLSGSSYVQMPAGQSKSFNIEVPQAGKYDVMLSYIVNPDANIKIGFNHLEPATVSLKGSVGDAVQIKRIDTVDLPQGAVTLDLKNPDPAVPADIDALILYPVDSYATYALPGGGTAKVLRDGMNGSLTVGTIEQVDGRHRISLALPTAPVKAGSGLRIQGTVMGADGASVSGEQVKITSFGRSVEAQVDSAGRFAATLAIPTALTPGPYRVRVATALGEATGAITIDRASGGGSSDSPGSAGGVGGGTLTPTDSLEKGILVVTKELLQLPKDGSKTIKVTIPEGNNSVRISQEVLKEAMSLPIVLAGQQFEITLTPDVLAELFERAKAAGLDDWTLYLGASRVEDGAAAALIQSLAPSVKAKLRQGSPLYEFTLSLVKSGKAPLKIHTFANPLPVALKIGPGVNSSLSGIYFIGDNGRLEYAGGKLESGFMKVGASHFSKYGVLEYDKTFQDMPVAHWAYAAVSELAARHVVNGVNDWLFGKDTQLTRAEMTTLIVRAIGLRNPDARQPFTDVSEKSWYSADIASALEAGIITGRTSTIFAPAAPITRSEAAAILMRALKQRSITTPAGGGRLDDFADKSDVSPMFVESLSESISAGLLQGDHRKRLRPNDVMTRAEAAVMLLKFLRILESE